MAESKLITGLRKGIAGELPLTGKGGMFGGKGAAQLGEEALRDGYIQQIGEPTGRSKTPRVRLTERGVAAIAEVDSPREMLQRVSEQLSDLQAVIATASESLERLRPLVHSALQQAGLQGVTSPPMQKAQEASNDLVTHLHEAYQKLCRFVEFRDGLVELPALYHMAQRSLASLTVEQFHDELKALWKARRIELHILNEVRKATEPELGIRQDLGLYYYVFWKEE